MIRWMRRPEAGTRHGSGHSPGRWSMVCVLVSIALTPGSGVAQSTDSFEARLRLDVGPDPIVEPGEGVRIFYEVTADAYVAIFRIDTDGRGSLLYPQYPNVNTRARAGRENRLVLAESRRWEVEDRLGEGWFVMIASEEPLDFSVFNFDVITGWVLTTVTEPRYDDELEAVDDYVVAVLPQWEEVAYAVDLLPYRVVEDAEAERAAAAVAQPEPEDGPEDADTPDPDLEATDGPSDIVDSAPEDVEPRVGERPSDPAPQVVIVMPRPMPPRYVPPPVYRPAPRYGPPPPRYVPCCRYRAPAYYGPPPRVPRVRTAPPGYRPRPGAPPRGRGRYKVRPTRVRR